MYFNPFTDMVAFVTNGMVVALDTVRGYGETKRLAIRPLLVL
jgi:hypothetical protein